MFTGFRLPQSTSSPEVAVLGLALAGDARPLPTLPNVAPRPFPTAGPISGDGQVSILPFPLPSDGPVTLPAPGAGLVPGGAAGSPGLPERVVGTEGNDRIELAHGTVAAGLGGADVFVLTADPAKAGQPLAIITDFNAGDSLDLGKLGPDAKVLGRETPDRPWGADRISIDFDGNGAEDGFVLVSSGRAPDLGGYQPYPMPMPIASGEPRPLFTGAPGGFAVGGGGDAAGIRLTGDFTSLDGYDLSVI